MRFSRDLLEQARALGAVHEFGWSAIVAGQDVGDRLAEDYIAATLKEARASTRREAERRASTAPPTSAAGGAGADGEPVAEESQQQREERVLEQARAEREAQRERQERAIAYNLELGLLAFKHLTRVKLDERVLRILASVDVGGSLRGIATRGARLALPGWVTQAQRANNTTKTTYLEDTEATNRAAAFLLGAESASDVAGRTLTLLALASLADENAVAASRRSFYTIRFAGPWADRARDDLDAIVRERIKEGQLPALDAILSQRIGERSEADRARSAVTAVDGHDCPAGTCDGCQPAESAAAA